jgi:ribosomal protein L37E
MSTHCPVCDCTEYDEHDDYCPDCGFSEDDPEDEETTYELQ